MGQELRYYKPASLSKTQRRYFDSLVRGILDSGHYTSGRLALELSERIRDRTGYRYAVPFGQCTHAIFVLARWYRRLGYRTLYSPAFTWPSTYLPFEWCGFEVRFVDIDTDTWLPIFPVRRPKMPSLCAPTDTFGSVFPADSVPDTRGLFGDITSWIDSAQSIGAEWDSAEPHRVVSLSGSKIITSAEGGVLLTQVRALADFAVQMPWFSRMNELEAALGIAYMQALPRILESKRRICAEYRRCFPDLGWQSIPVDSNHYIVAATMDERETFVDAHPDVEFRRYYSPAVDETGWMPDSFPAGLKNTTRVAARILSFPSWPDMPLRAIREMEK